MFGLITVLLHQVADMLKNHAAFLLRLHYILSMMNPHDSSAQWDKDGKSFHLVDPKRFLDDVFSIYYDNLSYPLFEQKLRSWGFIKKPNDGTSGASASTRQETPTYWHPFFVRDGKPIICRIKSEMQVNIAGNQQRQPC